jgi:hypothetical protein
MVLKSSASIFPVIVRLVIVFRSSEVKTVESVPAVARLTVLAPCADKPKAKFNRRARTSRNFIGWFFVV